MSGWVCIHRKMMEKKGYFSEPFCRNMAWIDLILLANHDTGHFRCRGIRVEIKRGQVGFGVNQFCTRWRWSRGKVDRFLFELETDKQIVRQKNNVTTLISIVNYDQYQLGGNANSNANSNANGQQTVTQMITQTVTQTDTNNNDNKNKKNNNDNNENKYSDQVGLEFSEEKILNPPSFPTWREEVSKFLKDQYFIQQQAQDKKISYADLLAFMKQFVYDKNLAGDFKNHAALKKHFGNWYKKYFENFTKLKVQSKSFIDVPGEMDYENMEKW